MPFSIDEIRPRAPGTENSQPLLDPAIPSDFPKMLAKFDKWTYRWTRLPSAIAVCGSRPRAMVSLRSRKVSVDLIRFESLKVGQHVYGRRLEDFCRFPHNVQALPRTPARLQCSKNTVATIET